jgi:histidyl-tRNA synthetase
MHSVTTTELEEMCEAIWTAGEFLKQDVAESSNLPGSTARIVVLGIDRVLTHALNDARLQIEEKEMAPVVICTVDRAIKTLQNINQLREEPMSTRTSMMKLLTETMLARSMWGEDNYF